MNSVGLFGGIPYNKRYHMSTVGRLMYAMAEELKWNRDIARDMFVLGCTHDIGYSSELGGNVFTHGELGAKVLKGYAYREEVRNHGKLNCKYTSPALDLLNVADLHVDNNGQLVSVETRLQDIAKRYGHESDVYKSAKQLSQKVCTASMELVYQKAADRIRKYVEIL